MALTAMETRKRSWLGILLRLGLGLVLAIWAVWHLDWGALVDNFQHIHLIWVVTAVCLFLLGLALKLVAGVGCWST